MDLQNEADEEEQPVVETASGSLNSNRVGVETIEEEAKEEVDTAVVNEVVEETNNPPKEAPKEEVKEKPKRQTQKDKINCGKCGKEMTIKSYKYSHEKNAKGNCQKDQSRSIQAQKQKQIKHLNPKQSHNQSMKKKSKKPNTKF